MAAASTSEQTGTSEQAGRTASVPPLALVLIAAISILWGLNWPAMKFVVGELDPWTFRAVSLFAAGSTLLVLARLTGEPMRLERRLWLPFIPVTALAVTGWHMLTAYGLGFIGGGRAAIIAFTMPIWAMVLGAIFLHERIGVRGFCALALGMSGIGALIGAELLRLGAAPLGTLLILAAAFCWGAGTVGIKAYEWRIGTIALSGWMFLIGGVPILAVWAATVAPPDLSRLTVPGVAALGYVIFVAMVFCFTAFLRIVRLLPAGVAAISTLVIPVVGVISSSVLLHEPIGYNEILALVLVLGALSLVLLKPRGGR
ncbi:MAG: DMT family transporter [Geminicoccaceae bacterium]|nr:DMT family transporter [Geminicoccaceae bacterium]